MSKLQEENLKLNVGKLDLFMVGAGFLDISKFHINHHGDFRSIRYPESVRDGLTGDDGGIKCSQFTIEYYELSTT